MKKQEAVRLFGRLRAALLDLDNVLGEVVEARAWESLGYSSFAEAWQEQLGDMRLSGRLAATVAYAMFDTGSTPEQVATAVHGLGPVKVKNLHKAYIAGMDAADGERFMSRMTHVHGHRRRLDSRERQITLRNLNPDEVDMWRNAATAAGMSLEEWVSQLARDNAGATA